MSKKTSDKKKKFSPVKPLDYYLYLLENSKDILYLINAETGKFEYVSSSTIAISGFTVEEIFKMGMKGINERTHPDDLRAVDDKIRDILAKGSLPKNYNGYIEIRFKHKAGHYVWFGINRNFITDGNGRLGAVVGSIRDITEIKLLQQRLENSLENYKTLYYGAKAALYRVRISDGKMLECNESMAKLLGYENREQCLGKHYTAKSYVDPKRRSKVIKLLEERGQVDGLEIETWRADGSAQWIKVSAQVYPEKGYIEGTIWDITASKILTPAENHILEQIMLGKSSKEIAFQLKRSIRTIEDHRAHIMQKLGAHNLVELAQKTTRADIGPQ
ncbi:MAG: PAS domain S-box protein [Phycisphaerae bacterium]|jgi:PAS domain S-box-containing protein